MTDIQAWLDQGRALIDDIANGRGDAWDATWDQDQGGYEIHTLGLPVLAHVAHVDQEDHAVFIADARTRLPQALDALQAILDLHKPIEFVGHSATWLHCTQGCATYPCPTVEAVQRTLTTPTQQERNQ